MKKILILTLLLIGILNAVTVTTTKKSNDLSYPVVVNFKNMTAKNKDWIGIYPVGTSNAWANVKKWAWTNDKTNGIVSFKGLRPGAYEARAFYNNSYHSEATTAFTVFRTDFKQEFLDTNKDTYNVNEKIIVRFKNMKIQVQDWIGIYREGSSTARKNIIQKRWTGDIGGGKITFNGLPKGRYVVRSFSFDSIDAKKSQVFIVGKLGTYARLSTVKVVFNTNENVRINFKNINGSTKDWLAIYPAGSNNNWGNVIKWKWNAGGVKEGQANFDKLPVGDYEARVFYNNTFKLEAKVAFRVINNNTKAVLTTTKAVFSKNEDVLVNFRNTDGTEKDWLGIYPANSNNDWANVIKWQWKGNLKHDGQINFTKLPVGDYEARYFYNNGFKVEAKVAFKVSQ